ncbi:MAG: beta-L-arabinofuranosidase domain-containing protein [Verrucomicrobiae bacterium]
MKITNDIVSNHSQLTRLPLGSITAQGWLKAQLERSKAGMGGHLDELEPDMIGKPYVTRDFQSKVSPGWSGEISGTYWTGLVQLAFTLNDAELKAKAEKWVRATLALQEDDGYLGSYRKTDNRHDDFCPWSANWCYRALLSWHDATGDRKVLDAVHRGLLWFVENWAGDQKTDYAAPTLTESMIIVYLKTGDERLYQWCLDYLAWLDKNDNFKHGMASFQRAELEYNDDHAVAFGEMVKHPAMVFMAGGKPEFLAATRNGIKQIMDKCWQCTGAPASNFEYLSPPSANHETEYCNFTTFLNTFSWMARITGEAKYGDLIERVLFNGAQGGRMKDERAISYNSSPNQFFASMHSCLFGCEESFGVYAPNIQVACCPAHSVVIYPEYVRGMFLCDRDENLFLPTYGPCALEFVSHEGTKISIREETLYPFDETITLHIKTSARWRKRLMLRIPNWCKDYSVTLNGTPIANKVDSHGYLAVEQTWHDDTLAIIFQMEPNVVAVDDVYFQKEPLRAVECGPLLFAFKYPETWNSVTGTPVTPLPPDWSWHEASCVPSGGKLVPPPIYSLKLDELDGGKAITKKRSESAYPWDESPLKLLVPMHRSQTAAYPRFTKVQKTTPLPYGNPVTADPKAETVELVPFGCTILRMSCFTICK